MFYISTQELISISAAYSGLRAQQLISCFSAATAQQLISQLHSKLYLFPYWFDCFSKDESRADLIPERRLDALEERYDEQFKLVFDAIRALMKPPEKPKKKIGFEVKEGKASYGKKKGQGKV